LEILTFSLYAEVKKKPRVKKQKTKQVKIDSDQESEGDEADDFAHQEVEDNDEVVGERRDTADGVMLANQLDLLQTNEHPTTTPHQALGTDALTFNHRPSLHDMSEEERSDLFIEALGTARSRLELRESVPQIKYDVLLEEVNMGLEADLMFGEAEMLKRCVDITTVYIHEDEKEIVFT